MKLTKNTGDTEQNNHISKFQVNFLQLLLEWTKRVSQGELCIEIFIKEAAHYKLESYVTQH